MNKLVWSIKRWQWRLGTLGMLAVLLAFVAIVIAFAEIIPLHKDLAKREQQLQQQRLTLERPPLATEVAGDAAGGELRFTRFLGDFYALAARDGIELPQVEYQVQSEDEGRLQRHLVRVPIKSSYPVVRSFLGELRRMRGVRLDTISMSRDDIAQTTLDIDLRFSYLVEVVP